MAALREIARKLTNNLSYPSVRCIGPFGHGPPGWTARPSRSGSPSLETGIAAERRRSRLWQFLCGGRYRRPTRQRRQHGPDASSYQLAETADPQDRRRSETRGLSPCGRADQVDAAALRRLAQRRLRVAPAEGLDLPAPQCPPDGGIDAIEQVYAYGVRSAARVCWEERGSGPRRREKRPQDGGDAPHETAWLAMTANRLARPASTWACAAPWRADAGEWPEAKTWALAPRSRALDGLRCPIAALEQARCCRTAALGNAAVDLSGGEPTTRSWAVDAAAAEGAGGPEPARPARRHRGRRTEGRAGHPPVGGGLALRREGLPVRSWGGLAPPPRGRHATPSRTMGGAGGCTAAAVGGRAAGSPRRRCRA